jgi:hypothetical protein
MNTAYEISLFGRRCGYEVVLAVWGTVSPASASILFGDSEDPLVDEAQSLSILSSP